LIFDDFLKSLRQMDDARFRGVLLRSLGLTILLLAGFVYGIGWFLAWLIPGNLSLPWIGEITFLDNLGAGIGVGAGLILSVFLMIPVATIFIGAFLEQIAGAVEAKHYPELSPIEGAGWWDVLVDALRFFSLLVVVNLVALVLYLLFAPLAPFLFWAVNGYLLGREYFQLVAMRRLSRQKADALRKQHFAAIWLAGILMAIPLSIPVLNLIVPILGVATFTHQFHRFHRQS